MLHASEIRDKVKSLLNKFSHRSDKPEVHEFVPDDSVGTAPITGRPLSGDGPGGAQRMVWENENASMQDKSYSFDEETTDADYEFEDDFEFEDEDDVSRARESRYS